MTGKRFGRLTVLEKSHKDARQEWYWKCRCDCGNIVIVSGNKLRSGNTSSCGCLQKESRGKTLRTHGLSETKLYTIHRNMLARCYNKKSSMYYRYGKRGIKVCEAWRTSFEEFAKWALSAGYTEGLSIERADVNGDYSPDNCRWITKKQQYLNRSDSHLITAFGKTQTIKEWAEETGIKYDTIERRINKYSWSPEKAVSKPGGNK